MIKEVKGYDGYYVTDEGTLLINRRNRQRESTGVLHKDGMYRVLIANSDEWVVRKLHELVAEAFCPNPNNFSEVIHIDKDYSNNRPENLLFVSDERYDKEPYTKDGKYLYEIEGYPLYLIQEETHTIYSDKGVERTEMTISSADSYALRDVDGNTKRKHKDIWWDLRKEEFSKKEYKELLKKYGADNDLSREVVSLITGKVYKDSYYAAEDTSNMTAHTIKQHCYGTVSYPLYAWKEEWDGRRLYDAKIREVESGTIYDTVDEASEACGDTPYTIWKHCNGKVEESFNIRYEYATEKLINTNEYKGYN